MRGIHSAFRRVDRPSSRAPRMRRFRVQPARCGECPPHGGPKLSQVALDLRHAQPDRAKPVRRGGRPPRGGQNIAQRFLSEANVMLPKPSSVTRGGRPPRRRLRGLAVALRFRFRLGLAECDASFCERWLFRDEIGMTDINQLGLLNISDISDLTKELSKIGGKLLELAWSESRAQFFCPVCSRS